MSVILKALNLESPKAAMDPTTELAKLVAGMDEYQARLVLSFVKTLFGPGLTPEDQANVAVEPIGEEGDDIAA